MKTKKKKIKLKPATMHFEAVKRESSVSGYTIGKYKVYEKTISYHDGFGWSRSNCDFDEFMNAVRRGFIVPV